MAKIPWTDYFDINSMFICANFIPITVRYEGESKRPQEFTTSTVHKYLQSVVKNSQDGGHDSATSATISATIL